MASSNAQDQGIAVGPDTVAPQGRAFIVVGPHYWGKGSTPRAALAQCRKAGLSGRYRGPFAVREVSEDSYLNDFGAICIPAYDETKKWRVVLVESWRMCKE